MSDFFYFIPHCGPQIGSKRLQELGLYDRIDKPVLRQCRNNTPSGEPGAVLRQNTGSGQSVMSDPANQTWTPAPQGDQESPPYWVGYNTADPPGPGDLLRDSIVTSVPYTLQDGNTWQIPIIRQWFPVDEEIPFAYGTQLPSLVSIDNQGNAIAGDVIPRYTEIWNKALAVHRALYVAAEKDPNGNGSMSMSEMFKFAVDALAVNYRVSLLEMSILKALSTDDCSEITRKALDLDTYGELLGNFMSRSTPDDSNSSSGVDRPSKELPVVTDQL
ncbi:hypothetical protein LOC67_23365 [Stieleria sp. JC731]|uniref:hypothetical protein n=1 Tax=Pirellulaceae TaxID=2691357 RepID=UPI001E4B1E5A|nr:hypothetical protein [Stieleria sp. JC731]MCC9603499.1 hypothetical protein [Stieleria sp. JC731]